MRIERPLLTAEILLLIAALYLESFTQPPWNEPWTARTALQMMERYHRAGADFFIARGKRCEVQAMAIGIALPRYMGYRGMAARGLSPATYWIAELATAEAFRNTGRATALGRTLKDVGLAQGFRNFGARSRVDNPAALAVFRHLGLAQHSAQYVSSRGVLSRRAIFVGRF